MNDSQFIFSTCNDTRLLKNWSEFCLDTSDDFPEQYFPADHKNMFLLGTWTIANALFGFVGNLLTIIAIPYAAKRNKLASIWLFFIMYYATNCIVL